ncbi:hypothetical protein AAFF_G00127540 [Aldrovandia affinis]|uniref:Ig-like domain-containing protein n=1 Tax=Aldrovandia affinis TaxID=143900 RepID=A0AAD7T126_9TELE|nr:hypothetical protein AAFF_G00127540 [Aldrovandia affinis]
MLPYNKYLTLWMILSCGLVCAVSVMGQSHCRRAPQPTTFLTAALNSDILLPCNFKPSLLQEAQSGDVATVWTQDTVANPNLVELKLSGQPLFWNTKGSRVMVFPHLFHEGNFSILIKMVEKSDLSLYYCELFDGVNCSMAHQEVELRLREVLTAEMWARVIVDNWYYIAAGGTAFVFLLVCCACCVRYRCVKPRQSCCGKAAIDGGTEMQRHRDWIENNYYGNYCQDGLPPEIELNKNSLSSANRKQHRGNGKENSSPIYANSFPRRQQN